MILIMLGRMHAVHVCMYTCLYVCVHLCMYVGVYVRLEQAGSGLFWISPGLLGFLWVALGFWASLDVSQPASQLP